MLNCDQCEYKATEKLSLKEHAEWEHHGVSFACDQCGYKKYLGWVNWEYLQWLQE